MRTRLSVNVLYELHDCPLGISPLTSYSGVKIADFEHIQRLPETVRILKTSTREHSMTVFANDGVQHTFPLRAIAAFAKNAAQTHPI